MIEHVIEALDGVADEILLAANYKVEALEAHLTPRYDHVRILTEAEPLGTGGAVKNVADQLDGPFLVFNGDVITPSSLRAMVDAHRRSGARVSIALTRVADVTGLGVVEVKDSMEITRFVEKPLPEEAPSDLVNAGIYLLEPEVLDLIPGDQFVSMEQEIFPQLEGRGLWGHLLEGTWADAGTRGGYLLAQSILLGEVPEPSAAGARIVPPVSVDDAEVGEGATVGPNVYLGPGCVVRDAVVRDSGLLGDVQVESGAVVEGSILGEGVRCLEGARVHNAIVAEGSEVSAGTRLEGQTGESA